VPAVSVAAPVPLPPHAVVAAVEPVYTPDNAAHGDVKLKPEVLIFQDRVSMWLGSTSFACAGLAIILGFAMLIWGSVESDSWWGKPCLILGLTLLASCAIMIGYVILQVRGMRYKITTRLIEREQGIIFRRVDAFDLLRVQHVELRQSILDRLCGIGTIEIYSSDKTDPDMLLEAIPDARVVYEKLRDAVIELSQRRNIIALNS
jgi:membrane protein YdbS with pleckstrin-like domain